ncbi:hypothetical protein HYH03_005587 [Edaphochlamys debaryana]|uniref:Uncharacterized protein n=1 Tax=Edaphochlamys debaryana TaxID=47281 RepID=A0A835Y799_9CHLO|nr:hypothetical protein HYH03_005587 [Edaphochlamys debaryana]|eukprot:KAG2496357.1 hypothetical protein HYH03_005587 [Edaphochlamys debaryana]
MGLVPSCSLAQQAGDVAAAESPFLELGVDPLLVDGLRTIDVTRPSPVQVAALPAILTGANCAVQSYTGSGKTLAYLLPVLTLALRRYEAAEADPRAPRRGGYPDVPIQALVVAPSQELAMQIMRVARSLLPPDLARTAVQQVIGGANPKRQAEALSSAPGPLLVVGTPGRLGEMVRSGSLKLHHCRVMVLDEADQLLAPAFAEDVAHINDHCGKRLAPRPDSAEAAAAPPGAAGAAAWRQTVLVSATLTPSVMARAGRWCPAPRFVSAGAVPGLVQLEDAGAAAGGAQAPSWGWGVRGWDGPASPVAPRTKGSAGGVQADQGLVPSMPPQLVHCYLVAEPRHKVDVLRRAIHALGCDRALVFMNFQQRLQDAVFKLQARGMKVGALHGEMPRLARSNLLASFRRGKLRALMVSDVAARGIDVPSCDAVFHLELPSSAAHYAHRAGRTGRLSAALAAQAAADAAAAAVAAAEAVPGTPEAEAAARAAAKAASEPLLEQAAGTVVTIIAPQERFVVEKLADQLGVALVEAHLSHGELRLGAPPAGYSWERDGDRDREEAAAAAKAKAKGKAEAGRRDSGGEASTSGRGSSAEGGRKQAGGKAAASDSTQAGKAKGGSKRADDDEFDVIEDPDDDVVLDDEDAAADGEDYEILDEDLAAFKALRPAEVRRLGAASVSSRGVAAAAAAAAAAGISLKGKLKQRKVLDDAAPAPAPAPKQDVSAASSGAEGPEGAGNRSAAGGAERAPASKARPAKGTRAEPWAGAPWSAGAAAADAKAPKKPTSRADVMAELRKELDELKAEKDKDRAQRKWAEREQGRGGAGGGGKARGAQREAAAKDPEEAAWMGEL